MSQVHSDISNVSETDKENLSINVPETDDSGDNFSFQKLRGTVVQFEKKQKEHYHNNIKNRVCPKDEQNQRSGIEEVQRTVVQIGKTYTNHGHVQEKSSRNDTKCHNNHEDLTETQTNKTLKDTLEDKEDFSFQTLRQRAIEKSGGKASRKLTEEEDFSFQTLKERAINPSKSNNSNKAKFVVRSESNHISNVTTPGRRTTSLPKTPLLDSKRVIVPNRLGTNFSTPKKGATQTPKKGTPFDPNMYKLTPKIRKEEVQATDNSHASVQKLSQWLADDPFEKKKQIIIHKGEQIAHKAKIFENEEAVHGVIEKKQTRVEREREYFRQGGVSEGKQWLRNAFGSNPQDNMNTDVKEEELSVLHKKRMFEEGAAFKKNKKLR
jgi:hypothetical protein